jgi:hypothetical protein
MIVARELSRGRLPHALVGRSISVVDERGVVAVRPGMEFCGCRTRSDLATFREV